MSNFTYIYGTGARVLGSVQTNGNSKQYFDKNNRLVARVTTDSHSGGKTRTYDMGGQFIGNGDLGVMQLR